MIGVEIAMASSQRHAANVPEPQPSDIIKWEKYYNTEFGAPFRRILLHALQQNLKITHVKGLCKTFVFF